MEYGDILNKSITAEDVTEAFTSTELRLKHPTDTMLSRYSQVNLPRILRNLMLDRLNQIQMRNYRISFMSLD